MRSEWQPDTLGKPPCLVEYGRVVFCRQTVGVIAYHLADRFGSELTQEYPRGFGGAFG